MCLDAECMSASLIAFCTAEAALVDAVIRAAACCIASSRRSATSACSAGGGSRRSSLPRDPRTASHAAAQLVATDR